MPSVDQSKVLEVIRARRELNKLEATLTPAQRKIYDAACELAGMVNTEQQNGQSETGAQEQPTL